MLKADHASRSPWTVYSITSCSLIREVAHCFFWHISCFLFTVAAEFINVTISPETPQSTEPSRGSIQRLVLGDCTASLQVHGVQITRCIYRGTVGVLAARSWSCMRRLSLYLYLSGLCHISCPPAAGFHNRSTGSEYEPWALTTYTHNMSTFLGQEKGHWIKVWLSDKMFFVRSNNLSLIHLSLFLFVRPDLQSPHTA